MTTTQNTDKTPLDLLNDAMNDTDDLLAAIRLSEGEDGHVSRWWTLRQQPARHPSEVGAARVLHQRIVKIDLDGPRAVWQADGLVLPYRPDLLEGLTQSWATSTSALNGNLGNPEDLLTVRDGIGGEDDAEAWLTTSVDELVERGDDDRPDRGDGEVETVECQDCGQPVREDKALVLDLGGARYYRHRGACPEGEDQ